MTLDPNSRVQVLETPVMSPGVCVLCGSAGGDHRKFVDFGKEIDFYGNVYFCSFCIVEVMQAIEFIPVDNFDRLHESYRDLNIRYDKAMAELKSVKDALGNLLRGTSDISSNYPADNSGSGPEHPEDSESANVEFYEPPENRDSEAVGSSNVEGSDDLFDSSDFDDAE